MRLADADSARIGGEEKRVTHDDHTEEASLAAILGHLTIEPLDEREMPIAAFLLIKTKVNESAEESWVYRNTPGMNLEELLGSLLIQVELLKKTLVESWGD